MRVPSHLICSLCLACAFTRPYARYGRPACDFDSIREAHAHGLDVVEVSHASDNGNACHPDMDCLAAFLAAAKPYTYLTCFASAPPSWPEMRYPLGEPAGLAVEKTKVQRSNELGQLFL